MNIALNRFSLALAASLLSATALAGSANAQDEGLVVYNAQHESLGREWIDAFTKETGIKVTMRQGSDMQFANQIIQEGDASPADVFLTENSPAMTLVDGAGLFAPIEKETLDQVPEQYRPADGMWTGIAARTTVFAYDKTKLTEDPRSLPTTRRSSPKTSCRSRCSTSQIRPGRAAGVRHPPAPTSRPSLLPCCS